MDFRLRTLSSAFLFLTALTTFGLSLAFFGGKAAMAQWLASSQNSKWAETAIGLDPSNAMLHYRLASLLSLDFASGDPSRVFRHFRRSAELNPHIGSYWLALAEAAERMGDRGTARDSIQRAVTLRPMSPKYWWTAGNFYLRDGSKERGWDAFRRLLELSPGHAEAVFRLCHQAAGDPRIIGERILPARPSPALQLSYVNFLSRQGEHALAFSEWQRVASAAPQSRTAFSAARPYIENLLTNNRLGEARSVWDDLLKLRVILAPPPTKANDLVFNGDFEQMPLDAGFDWRAPRLPYIATNLQAPGAFRGAKAGRVDFNVPHNVESEVLYQVVPVEPRREYRLEAHVRSQGVTSTSGPRLRITAFASPSNLNMMTPPVLGTTQWHVLDVVFATGPEIRLIRLSVWRERSRTFPTDIAGTFWIDAVSLTPLRPHGDLATAAPVPSR